MGAAAKRIYQKIDTPLSGHGMPHPEMPSLSGLRRPGEWAKGMARGYGSHLKSLGSRGGVTRALKDISPLSLGLTVLPELTGQGVISATKNAPEGEKARTLGGALGGILGGQLMWRTGLLGSLGGSYLGSRLGERVGGALTGGKRKKRQVTNNSTNMPVSMQPGMMGPEVDPRHQAMKIGERLPEVSGTLPPFSVGGPGREDVASRGRVSNRNNEVFGGDSLRNVGELDKIFHTGQGLGSQGGQPYADGSIYRHLKISPSGKINSKMKRELGDSSLDSASSDYL